MATLVESFDSIVFVPIWPKATAVAVRAAKHYKLGVTRTV